MRSDGARSRLRVCLVIHSFDRGGSGRVAAYLARGFAEAGLDVALVAIVRGGDVDGIAAAIAGDRISIRFLGTASGIRPYDLARGIVPLARLFRELRPDVVVSCANNMALACTVALRLSRQDKARLFLKTTNPIATSRHTGLLRWLRRLSYRMIFPRAEAVWTLSAAESAEMREAFPQFASLFRDVANPYVTPIMLAAPEPGQPRGPAKTVISVARLTKQKRLERLVAAFAHVRTPGARLLILGEGEERPALEAMVAELGLGDQVSLPGYVDNVAASLHAADLFVLPSDYEGLPAVVLEAMAANCPVIGTDCFPAAQALLGGTEGCGIIADTDPARMGAMIDIWLDRPRPTHLRTIAERYSIANGVTSHLNALLERV